MVLLIKNKELELKMKNQAICGIIKNCDSTLHVEDLLSEVLGADVDQISGPFRY